MEAVAVAAFVLALPAARDAFALSAAEAELSPEVRAEELKAHVYRLSSAEFMGRKGVGAARAAHHLAAAFERLKLEPAFGASYDQPIPCLLKNDRFLGRNVGALLRGCDPVLRDEWVLVGAHFDHLGKAGGLIYPGADDNASGVAMLLEVAERFALQKEKPKRSVYFIAFDQEEAGLLGSTHFATRPPRDIGKLKAVLIADMLGRSMANVMDEFVFALGSETSPHLRRLLQEVRPEAGLKVGRLGADLIGTRSDYGPFRDRRVPFLFFSTGQHPDYHQPSDRPERIDYTKLEKISRWIGDLTWRLADDAAAPSWDGESAADIEEVRTVLQLLARVLDRPKTVALTDSQRARLVEVESRLQNILRRGRVEREERTWLVWTVRGLLVSVF